MDDLLYRIQFLGDQQAFKAFYQQHVFRLYQFAFAFLRQRQAAEEIVNDVFVKIWQQRARLDKIANLRVYLYVAVKHAALNHLRARPFAEESLDSLHVQHFRLAPQAEHLLLTHELQKAIASAIAQLPPKCQMIFKLVKEDGLSYKEVAGILDISAKTVDAQLAIAIRKLSVLLTPFLQTSRRKQEVRP
ncbi:RNA polymerase sigma-70 factor [Chitinophaga lutea]